VAINRNKVIASAQKYAEKGAYDKAIAEYLKIVKEEPEDVRTWLKVGDLYAKKGARNEATSTYMRVGEFYAGQGFYLKAVAVYKQILKLDPTVVNVNVRLAELYQQLGLLSDAQNQYEHVAAFYQRAGRSKEALEVMQKLVELDPENVPSRIKLAELYSKQEMREEAVREFGVAATRLREQGRIDDFIKVAERLLWHKPDEVALGRELAGIYIERGDPKRALAKLQQCFQADSRDIETLSQLAKAFQTIGQLPKTISVYKEMARLFAERGDQARRTEVLQAILAIAPDDPEANRDVYGSAQVQPGPSDYGPGVAPGVSFSPPPQPGAYGESEPLLPAEPSEFGEAGPPPMYGEFYAESGSVEVDDAFVEEVAEVEQLVVFEGPQDHSTEISRLMTETEVFVKYGLHDKAIEHLQKIFELEPVHIEARERLKDIYVQIGDVGRAVAELVYLSDLYGEANPQGAAYYVQEALALAPGHPDVLSRMSLLGLELPAQPTSRAEDAYEEVVFEPYEEPSELLLDADEVGGGGAELVDLPPGRRPSVPAPEIAEDTVGAALAEHAPASHRIEEELEEVDFFIQQGLFDEARALLSELSTTAPGNALVGEKLAELRAASAQHEPLLDRSFDLGAQIPLELESGGGEVVSTAEEEVKDVFAQFKRGVAQQIDAGDADTHFDLGVAYKEMGLIEDAIAEFEIARESPEREAIAMTMIGHCHMQNGKATEAINAFKRGLYADHRTTTEELDLYYELGSAYLVLSDAKEALYYFLKVAKRAPDYRDVRTHIAAIQSGQFGNPSQDDAG
jgi:tetratricopeptide (TPR) repeat protein